ncbi:hypothetical protein ACULPM_06405 [Thermophilibacter sp. ZX-H3]|uniref:hypothetical protein n=1 Tax=unclassified Thermophilibacter TaxID=2847308 RepID=UPI004040BB79
MNDDGLCLRVEDKAEKLVSARSSAVGEARQKLKADEAEQKRAKEWGVPNSLAGCGLVLIPAAGVPVGWILNVSGCVLSAFAGAGAPPSTDLVGVCVATGFVLSLLCFTYTVHINGKAKRLTREIEHDKELIELEVQRLANAKALRNRANLLTGRLRIALDDERDSVVAQLGRIETEIDSALS